MQLLLLSYSLFFVITVFLSSSVVLWTYLPLLFSALVFFGCDPFHSFQMALFWFSSLALKRFLAQGFLRGPFPPDVYK